MAVHALQAEIRAANQPTEQDNLYAAWRFAKAQWDSALYSPENRGNDLCDEVNERHCDATCDALNAFLLHPADTPGDLSRKLRVFRDEQIAEGWTKAPLIVEQLVKDASHIASEWRRK